MIEIPEAESLSRQLTETVGGKRIAGVVAGLSPHKFAWYHGDAKGYDTLLRGKTIDAAVAHGGMLDQRVALRTGLKISHHRLEFRGLCRDCQHE